MLQTALAGATSGSAAGAGATATASPHPNGALKVGIGYDTFLRPPPEDDGSDKGFLLVASVKAVYAIEDFLQACTSSPQMVPHATLQGPSDYLAILKAFAALPDVPPPTKDPKIPVTSLTLGDLKDALAAPPSKWKANTNVAGCKKTLNDLFNMLASVNFTVGNGHAAKAEMSDPKMCGTLKKDGIVCRTGGAAGAPVATGNGGQVSEFPVMAASWNATAVARANEWFIGLSILPNLIQVSYLPPFATGGPELTAKPLNQFVWPWSLALDMFWARNQAYFLGLEIGGGQGLPPVAESNICNTTTSGTYTAQSCQTAALSKASLGTSFYGTAAFLVPRIPGISVGSGFLGAELLATFASITNPSMSSQSPLSSATDTLVLTVPIFLGSVGSASPPSSGGGKGGGGSGASAGSGAQAAPSILGGVAPQVTLPFDSTKPTTFAVTVFVGGSNFL